MTGTLATLGLAALVVATGLVWAIVAVAALRRSGRRPQGPVSLIALLWIVGPLILVTVKLYPPDLSGPFPTMGRLLSVSGYVVGAIAMFSALRTPRAKAAPLALALACYYAALLLSMGFGAVPSVAEPLIVTPLLVLPFVIHGGYTYEWLLRQVLIVLRTIVLGSIAVALLAPEIAFNTVEAREVFGLSRLEGLATHPNTLAILAVILLLVELAGHSRILWVVPPLIALILAQSNTAVVAILATVFFIGGAAGRWLRRLAGAIVLVGIVIAFTSPAVAQRFISDLVPTTAAGLNGRTTIWAQALQGITANPLFGYGPTFLGEDYRNANGLNYFGAAAQAHNEFVQSLGVAGYVGVAGLGLLAVVTGVLAIGARRASNGLAPALFVVLVVRSITELSVYPFGVYINTIIPVVVLGVIAAATSVTRDHPELPVTPVTRRRDLRLSGSARR